MKVITTEKHPIKMWLEEIEDGAMEQAKNLANLPFLFKHVAIMPDSHEGYGMPIGGVIATGGVIIPNAVGVDIGCFRGDTMVPLLDGLEYSIEELSKTNEQFYVYSIDAKGRIVPGKATALKTRVNAELIGVAVSGGSRVVCTPDHRFMLLDGTYREARRLKPFDSLKPLYRSYQTRDGYEIVRTHGMKSIATHRLVDEYFNGPLPNGYIIHHDNHNWYDNRSSNLIRITAEEHSKHHRDVGGTPFVDETFKKKRLDRLNANGFYHPDLLSKKRVIAIRNITQYMSDNPDHFKNSVRNNGERGKKYLLAFNKANNSTPYTCEKCGKVTLGKGGHVRHITHCAAELVPENHKVLYVKALDYRSDVYCLCVEKYHNFALSAGVFVHNCGMCAVKTTLTDLDILIVKRIMGRIREAIPIGFDHHKENQEWTGFDEAPDIPVIQREMASARKQLGTLGGGNHFIEIQKADDGAIWVMLHSGSRNFGFKIAHVYNDIAKRLCERWYSDIPTTDLAFLPIEDREGGEYYDAMKYALRFAQANRAAMMANIQSIFTEETGAIFEEPINIHHNYAAFENHFGKNVIVHRKGATLAREGTIGIIPGSQGSKSYIVSGKGNADSFTSCSHGAGRLMGRKEAKRVLNLEDEIRRMNEKGIIHGIRSIDDLDEAAGAYKDIDVVMEDQKDLVDILVQLHPLAVIKG